MALASHDVIVIGSGLGGSAAGAILAREGLKVLILEKNGRVGGACSWYEKNGVRVDVGCHFISRGNRGPIGRVQRRLGARRLIRFLRPAPLFRVEAPHFHTTAGGLVLPAASLFRQVGAGPRERLGFLGRFLSRLALPETQLPSLKGMSVEEYLLSFTKNPLLMQLMSVNMGLYFVSPYWQASAEEMAWCTRKAFLSRDWGFPRGGTSVIPETFLEGARTHGAEVRTNSRVNRICVQGGRAVGVETADGTFLPARTVISTSSLKGTLQLAGEENFPPDYRARVAGITGSLSAIQVKVLLDRPVIREAGLVGFNDQRPDPGRRPTLEEVRRTWESTSRGKVPEMIPFFCTVPTNCNPGQGPSGQQLLTMSTAIATCDRPHEDPTETWTRALLDTLFLLYPEAESRVLWTDRVDSRFLESWRGKQGGPVISTGQVLGQVGPGRPGHTTPVEGLFLAGDCAGGRGIGTELACRSGIDCADEVLRGGSQTA